MIADGRRNRLDMIFARSGMGYVGAWDRGAVEIKADHLRRRSGELHGEINISSGVVAAGYGRLHRATFNFSSTMMRERLAKSLQDRARSGDSIPWQDYLEDFCRAVLEADQAGTPVIKVGQLPPQAAEGYLIPPFLPEGKASIVYAAGGTGKSYLAVLCAVMVATGKGALGWPVTTPGQVLYLDWETDAYEIDERLGRVARGMGIETPEILYRSCAGSLDRMAEDVAQLVADHDIRLVIVDSVGMASGTSHEGSSAEESAIKLFSAIRHLGTTVLCVDHVTGEDSKSEGAISKPYGSIYKVNLARSVWELKGTPAEEGQETHLALFHRKVNKGRLSPAIGLSVTHGPEAVVFKREDISDDGLVKGLSNTARVQRVLAGGSATITEIVEQTGLSDARVRVVLSRGRGQMFGKRGDGTWGLLQQP